MPTPKMVACLKEIEPLLLDALAFVLMLPNN